MLNKEKIKALKVYDLYGNVEKQLAALNVFKKIIRKKKYNPIWVKLFQDGPDAPMKTGTAVVLFILYDVVDLNTWRL